MKLSRWLMLIGIVVGIGCLRVAQRNAAFMAGYAVAERTHTIHAQEAQVAWLHTQVMGLESPQHLAQVAQERRLKLVAWSTLPSAGSPAPSGPRQATASQPSGVLVHVASVDHHQPSAGVGDNTED